jgi:glycosyltransferase involved in cell wall biosynthesis
LGASKVNFALSVIIPTRNRSNCLASALTTLQKQDFNIAELDIIVVDNGSTDNTKQVVESFVEKLPGLRYFYASEPGLHIGRHLGMNESKTEILCYLDDDSEPFPSWAKAIYSTFQNGKIALAGGSNLPKWEQQPPKWLDAMWQRDHSISVLSIHDLGNEIKEINPYFVYGCNFNIRKSVLLQAGGFHPDGMPDNLLMYRGDGETAVSEYIKKNGLTAMYVPDASIYHLVSKNRMTEAYFEKRSFMQGISDSFTALRNGKKLSLWQKIKFIMRTFKYYFTDKAKYKVFLSWQKGYKFHQNSYKTNPDMKKWVCKENFMSTSTSRLA